MEINKALEVMGFSSIKELKEVGERGLRKQFVGLVRGKHPDDAGRDSEKAKEFNRRIVEINEAHEVLKKTIKLPVFNTLGANKAEVKIVKLGELCKIYTGEKEEVLSVDGTTIDKGILRQKSVLVQIDVYLSIDGTYYNETGYVPWNIMDRYDVSVEVKDNELEKSREIEVRVGDKIRKISSKATSVIIPITYNSVNVNVHVERVIDNGK